VASPGTQTGLSQRDAAVTLDGCGQGRDRLAGPACSRGEYSALVTEKRVVRLAG
jgi:hypothetical protein